MTTTNESVEVRAATMRTLPQLTADLPPRLERYSYSRVGAYHNCPYAYHLQFGEGLLPVTDPTPMTKGTLSHVGWEAAIRAQALGIEPSKIILEVAEIAISDTWQEWRDDPFREAIFAESPELRDDADKLLSDALAIVDRTVRRSGLLEGQWETCRDPNGKLMVEYDVAVEIVSPVYFVFHGKVDWVAKHVPTGYVYEIDFKNRKHLTPTEDDECNAQHGVYQHLLRTLGIDVRGGITYQIRAEVPKLPKLNKPTKANPKAMARSAISTDWDTYQAALIAEGLDPNDYQDMRDKLSDFERLSFTLRTPEEAEGMWSEFVGMASLMAQNKLPIFRRMNPYNCKGCSYKDLCMERLRGKRPAESEMKFFGLTTRKDRGE